MGCSFHGRTFSSAFSLPRPRRIHGFDRQPERLVLALPPVRREDTTRLVDGGRLVTDGFPSVVLSLHGLVKGHVQEVGAVGAILIPDEETIQEAFEELGIMHFYLETAANGVSAKTPYFASGQPRFTVAFPAYRILLYNTTDKTVTVNVFAYLTD